MNYVFWLSTACAGLILAVFAFSWRLAGYSDLNWYELIALVIGLTIAASLRVAVMARRPNGDRRKADTDVDRKKRE